MDPTPAELRAALARLIGWSLIPAGNDEWGILRPGASLFRRFSSFNDGGVPDPANDLYAMARVEAALADRGFAYGYVEAIRDIRVGADEPGSGADWLLLTAPAAVRALAAWRVIRAAPVRPVGRLPAGIDYLPLGGDRAARGVRE